MVEKVTKIELLAPAKNLEVGIAAIDSGADAVYIGGPSFGARKSAGNSLEDIEKLCQYAHLFRVKVLLTLNTLLQESEYASAVRLAYACKKIGVDALIIQDLRLASILLSTGDFSGADGGIRLHASTQCDNRTLERVQELETMGFRRVVLARELSFKEISNIRQHTGVELESFVHGALCVSYSGACYLSESVCGRSANRGECAQMCRLPYDVLDANQHEILHQKHILSLSDLDRSLYLAELLASGVTTLKIEGRLKDVDYVRNVVAYYRQLLDSFFSIHPQYCASSAGLTRVAFHPNPAKTFHRGSTDYFSVNRHAPLVNLNTPKSTGEYVGIATSTGLSLSPGITLHNGDGLCFENEGFYYPNSRVRIPEGTPVYRNLDVDFHRQLSSKDASFRFLPVRILFEQTAEGFRLSMSGDATHVELSLLSEHIPAQNGQRAESVVRQQLSKLGGTHLEAESVEIKWSHPLFLPAAWLNDARRQLTARFLLARTKPLLGGCCEQLSSPSSQDIDWLVSSHPASHAALQQNAYGKAPLMTCKYCILYELGCCLKKNPQAESIPTYLRHQGRLFRITPHCNECYMTITQA